MLFINFLCLLYLMVLSNGHTISKSIDNNHKTDEVSETVTILDHTRQERTTHDKSHLEKLKQKFRREEKTTTLQDPNKATKLLIVPPKSTITTYQKTTTEHVKYKSQKRKAGGFWRKFKGKDKKNKHNNECKYIRNKERSVPNNRPYGWWKSTGTREQDPKPRRNNRKNKYAFILRQPEASLAKRDTAAANKGRKTVTNLQIDISPHMVSASNIKGNANKFGPTVTTQTMRVSNKIVKTTKLFKPTTTKNTVTTLVTTNKNENLSSKTTKSEDANFSDNISSMLASMTSQIGDLKKMYKIGKYPAPIQFNKQTLTPEFTTPYVPDFTGTAQIEELLRNIKVKAMEMVAENTPAVTDLITNAVTESVFEADPLLTHLQLITSAYLLNDNKIYDATSTDPQRYTDVGLLNASVEIGKSDTHNIVTRSFKDDTITIAHNVEDMLQRELKNIYKKVKNRVSSETKNASKAVKTTTKKIVDAFRKTSVAPIPKCSKPTSPKSTTTASTMTTISRHSRGTKSTKKADNMKPTATYDDYVMLTLYEQILEKTHQNNVMKMLATADFPIDKRWSQHQTVVKRSPEPITVALNANTNKLYEDGSTSPEYNYAEPSNVEQNTEPSYSFAGSDIQQTTFEDLSSKLSYNDYVNGYKHYLKFQKEQADQNFSALVKYQAHRHHNVDDIGKYILDKIPQLPSLNADNQVRDKRFFDDSDLDDQDISTKSDDSWFKKHFYFFIDSGPPKKYHTSQTVSLKPPVSDEYPKCVHGKNPEKVFIQIGDDSGVRSSTDINLAHLTKVLENMKRTTLFNIRKPPCYTIKTINNVGSVSNGTEKEIAPRVPINIVYKIIGNKRKREILTQRNATTPDSVLRYKRENISTTENPITTVVDAKATTEFKRHLTPITHTKSKSRGKMGYVDINLIPKQTAVVKLRENSTKRNKFREFFKKFYFKNMKSKKKTKRSSVGRVPRFNPFKKIKSIFKAKPYDKGSPNSVRQQNLSDYDMVITPIDTFKPVKYDKLLSAQDMQKQVPNISEVFYGDLDLSITTKAQAKASTKTTGYTLKFDEDFVFTTEKATTGRYDQAPDPAITTPSSTFAIPSIQEDPEVISINVKTLEKYSAKEDQSVTKTKLSMSLSDLDMALQDIQYKLAKTKEWARETNDWSKRADVKRTTMFYTKRTNPSVLLIRRPIEELTIDSKMTRVAKFPISKVGRKSDAVDKMVANDYISVQDSPMSSGYRHDTRERSVPSTERNSAAKQQNEVTESTPVITQQNIATTETPSTGRDTTTTQLPIIQNAYMKKKQPIVKVTVQKTSGKANKNMYFDYFNDLLMWHNDILNLDKVPRVYMSDVVEKRQKFTTPNVNNLMNELKDINLFLEKNPNGLKSKLLPTPSYQNQVIEKNGVIRSVGLNDRAVVSSKDFLIEGEAKYFQYNKPTKEFDRDRLVTRAPYRHTAGMPYNYDNRFPTGYGVRTPGKAVYRIPIKISKMGDREIPTTKVRFGSFPLVHRSTIVADGLVWEMLSNEPREGSYDWYATTLPGAKTNTFSTWDTDKSTSWRDTERTLSWQEEYASPWDEERKKILEADKSIAWDSEKLSTWNAAEPINWGNERPSNLNSEHPPSWNVERTTKLDAMSSNWEMDKLSSWLPPDSNAALPYSDMGPMGWEQKISNTEESAAPWSGDKLKAYDLKSSISDESVLWSAMWSPFWRPEKTTTTSTEATTEVSRKLVSDEAVMWTAKAEVKPWPANATNIFSLADIYYNEKLKDARRVLHRFGRLPTQTYTRPVYKLKGIRRDSYQKESPAVMLDTTLLAYDDEVETVTKVFNVKKLLRNSEKSTKSSKAESKKEKDKEKLTDTPVTQRNKHPVQYFTTPLPMKPLAFDKFLKEQGMDVEYVTAPIYDLPSAIHSFNIHKKPSSANLKPFTILQAIPNSMNKIEIKDNKKKQKSQTSKSKQVVLKFSKVVNKNNLGKLIATTKIISKSSKNANLTTAHKDTTTAKTTHKLNDGFVRYKRLNENSYNDEDYPLINEEFDAHSDNRIRKAEAKSKASTIDKKTTLIQTKSTKFENKENCSCAGNDPHYKDVEITIINFDNSNKMNRAESLGNTDPVLYDELSELADITKEYITEPSATEYLHNKLLYKDLYTDAALPKDYSMNMTGTFYHPALFTEPSRIHKPFGILYNLHRHQKHPHRVHISNHHYEYDIYFDNDKKATDSASTISPLNVGVTLPMSTLSSKNHPKKPSYTSDIDLSKIETEKQMDALLSIMEKNRYAKNAIQEKFKLLKLLNLGSNTKAPVKKSNKSSTVAPCHTGSWHKKRAEQYRLEEKDGFSIKFAIGKKHTPAMSTPPETEDKVYDMAQTIADMLNFGSNIYKDRKLSTAYDDIQNFDASKAFSKNAESANLLALSEKYDPYIYGDSDVQDSDAAVTTANEAERKPVTTNEKEFQFNVMDLYKPDNMMYNQLDRVLAKFITTEKVSSKEDSDSEPDEGFVFISSDDISPHPVKMNISATTKPSESIFLKIMDDDRTDDVAPEDIGFFKIVDNLPKGKGKPAPNISCFKIVSHMPDDTKVAGSDSDRYTTRQQTVTKFIDSDSVYHEAEKPNTGQEEQFFKFVSSDESDNVLYYKNRQEEKSKTTVAVKYSEDYWGAKLYPENENRIANFTSAGNTGKKMKQTKTTSGSVFKFTISDEDSNEGFIKFVSPQELKKATNSDTGVIKFVSPQELKKEKNSGGWKERLFDFYDYNNAIAKAETGETASDEGFFKFVAPSEADKAAKEGLFKFITPEQFKNAKKVEEVSSSNIINFGNVINKGKQSQSASKEGIFKFIDRDEASGAENEGFIKFVTPGKYNKAVKSHAHTEEHVADIFHYDKHLKPQDAYSKQIEDLLKLISPDMASIAKHTRPIAASHINKLQYDSKFHDDSVTPKAETNININNEHRDAVQIEPLEDVHWPISIPIGDRNRKIIDPLLPQLKMYQPELDPSNMYELLAGEFQNDDLLIASTPLDLPMIKTPSSKMKLHDLYMRPWSSYHPQLIFKDQPLKVFPRNKGTIFFPPKSWFPQYEPTSKKDMKTDDGPSKYDIMNIEGVYVEGTNDEQAPTYYEMSHQDVYNDASNSNKTFKEKDPPAINNRRSRDTATHNSTEANEKELLSKKRAVPTEDTYTAKDVAALEVIVDLMKNTLSYEEKDIAGVFNKPVVVDHAMKSIHQPHDSTNSIQVHIAIPYDTQNGKKRSPLEPVRVRKVFSAKMSTPVDLEYQVHSFESSFETTGGVSTSDDGLSPGMYLLVDKPKNGYALKPVKANIDLTDVRSRQAGNTPVENKEETTRREDIRNYTKVTLSKNFIAAVNRQLVELYENLTKVSTRETFVRKKRLAQDPTAPVTSPMTTDIKEETDAVHDETYRIKKKIDWEAVKKYFGHDRVCNCKCRANKTMCRACAASDAVVDELIFEFDNLGQYMQDHCTEIQTYFWMNPNGGLKLRNAVHRIDKSLHDYYKRVKGKCKGRPCERLNIMIDKRQFVKTAKVVKEDVGTQLLNDLIAVADDVNKTCQMHACYNPKFKERADSMLTSIKNCMLTKVKRSNNLVTKRKLIKNVYSLDNINVNIICKPENQVAENYEATTLSSSHSLPTARQHEHDSLFAFDIDDTHQKFKKRKGFKHLFPRRKKKDRFFTYYTVPDVKTPKVWFKRDTSNQIEMPLIADSGGSFWFDYLKSASTNEPRIARQTFEPNLNQKFNIEVVQTKNLDKFYPKEVKERKGVTDINTIYMTVRTNSKNSQRDADTKTIKYQTETDIDTLTTEALTHNINQLLEMFGNLNDLEKMNKYSNRSTMFLKATTKQVVKMKPTLPQTTNDELPQLPEISDNPYAVIKEYNTNRTTTAIKTTELENTRSLSNTLEDLERRMSELSKSGLTMSTILGKEHSKENIYKEGTEFTTKSSSTVTTKAVKTDRPLTTHTPKARDAAKMSKPSTRVIHTLPVIDTSTAESSTASTKIYTTKPTTTQARSLQTYTLACTTKDTFLSHLKSATLRFLGLRKTKSPCVAKSTKARRHTLSEASDKAKDETASGYANAVSNVDVHTTHENPTIVIINEYDNQLTGDPAHRNKNSEDYKNLLLSIIQYETNRLNNEWQRIAYGSERDADVGYRRRLSLEKGETPPTPLAALVPHVKDVTTSKPDTSSLPTTIKYEKIVISIPELQLPEPEASVTDLSRSTKKPTGLLNKLVSKIGMRVASHASKRKEKAVKQSYVRDVKQKDKSMKTTTTQTNEDITEASDTYPPNPTVCDLHATFDRLKKLHKELVEEKFEEYVKNIPCYKHKRLDRRFFINYRSGGMKWDWIRNKRSLRHYGKFRRRYDGELNCDVFETFEKGQDDIYRIKSREKRSIKPAGYFQLQWLQPTKVPKNELYVMLGDSATLDCFPHSSRSRLTAPQPQYTWLTDRQDMLQHDNVQVDGFRLVIWKAGPKNGGRYTCSLDSVVRKVINVNVVTLPAFDVVFLPTYKISKECTYEDLKAIQHLGRVMTKEASCGNVCSIRIDEPMCQRDRATNRSLIRSTAVLTMSPRRIKCSVQCRQNMLVSLVRLAAANVPALTNNEVVISKDGVNETLKPCVDIGRPMITHTLRKKDSGGHHEYHKLSSLIDPGKMHIVIICHAGYYLLREQRVCGPCPSNTSSSIGDNRCTPCPAGTVSEPGSSKCHAIDNTPRRYDWWWYPPCGYVAACAVVVCACGMCVALSLLMHMLSRTPDVKPDRVNSPSKQRIAQRTPNVISDRFVHTSRARPLSPSRVILARFFRPSLTSSRGTAADSQETRFEQWKERNMPPPLPPIDFDSS